jgi:FAD synthase
MGIIKKTMSCGLEHSLSSRGVDMFRGAAVVTMDLLPEKASTPRRTRQVNREPLCINRKSDWTYYAYVNTCTRVYRDLDKKLISAFTPTPTLRTSLQYFQCRYIYVGHSFPFHSHRQHESKTYIQVCKRRVVHAHDDRRITG